MKIARLIVRIVLGLAFVAFGVSGLLMTPPAMPGMQGVLTAALHDSHWMAFVSVVQIAIGVLLIVNRYVPLALIMLFAFLYNSFAFHITTSPAMTPMPLVVLLLALFVAWPYRERFGALLAARE